jgi:NitT/TauT family transport system substrate-binding protein
MPTAMASRGTFDAVLGWDPMMQRIVQAGYGKEVVSAKQFQEMAEITYPLILVAHKDYVAKNRSAVQGLVNAYAKAHKFIRENSEEALRIYSEAIAKAGTQLEESIVRTMMFEVDKFTGVNFIDSDSKELSRTRDFLHKTGQIASAPDLKSIIDPSFGEQPS